MILCRFSSVYSFFIAGLLALNLSVSFSMAEPVPPRSGNMPSPGNASINAQSIDLNEQGIRKVKEKKFEAAEELFRRALLADRYNLTAVFNLASIYLRENKAQLAIDLLTPYVQTSSNDPGLFARLGDAYFVQKNIKASIENYEKAHALNKGYPGVSSRLGTLYSLSNDLKNAETAFKEALEAEPKNSVLLANLSSILLANKKPTEAIAAAKRSLQIAPSPEVYITLGSAYRNVKDLKNAIIAFERARDLGDNRPELNAEIEEIEQLLNQA